MAAARQTDRAALEQGPWRHAAESKLTSFRSHPEREIYPSSHSATARDAIQGADPHPLTEE